MKRLLSLLAFLSFLLTVSAQEKEKLKGWHLLDPEKDGYMGISLNQAYGLLKDRKSTPVIVAVIDSGIDTAQEDLKNVLWKNEREINGNGKDDDGNGYTDDIYGWNFCGSKDGENLSRNSYEVTRVYHGWKDEFENKKEKEIPAAKKFLYNQWLKAAGIISKEYEEASAQLPRINEFITLLEDASKTLKNHLSVTDFTVAQLKPALQNPSEKITRSAALWTEIFSRSSDTAVRSATVLKEINDYKNSLENKIKRKLDTPDDTRGSLTKDKYTDINDRFYGNNNLKASSGNHGTLVSGVIGAIRSNGVGVDGIADNVRIMAIRAVPGGDEHDKDVALAIRYAVDNGAKIINMSFGKPVSPYKQFVDDAIRYAASKGVLLIHGSGNDGEDISENVFYPSPVLLNGKVANNFITVGASGDASTGGYAAPFSNYSKQWVDIFAPGMYIYSTATDNNYQAADGTSLAAPVVTGVAALLKSYFPDLQPADLITILKKSGTAVKDDVLLPGTNDKKVPFATLSSSGKIVNAFGAVKMALQKQKQ